MKIAKVLIPSVFICGFSAIGFMSYFGLKRKNEFVQQLMANGMLESHMFKLHEEMSFRLDSTLDSYERTTKIPEYRRVLMEYCEGKNILETCVGTSRNIKYYRPGINVTFIDWSPSMIEFCLTKPVSFIDAKYIIGNVKAMPFEDDSFDTVVDTFGLEYVCEPEKALKEMRRVCKKNGRILVLAHGLSNLPEYSQFTKFSMGDELLKGGYFNNRNWDTYIQSQGFQIERQERKVNGTIYFYVLRNNKPEIQPQAAKLETSKSQ